jgi:hypothetical protein
MKQFLLVLAMGVAVMSCKKNNDDVAPFLHFNQTSLSTAPVVGASAELIVESNVEWQVAVSSGSEWLQVNKSAGKGNDTIRVTVIKDNEGAQARRATITAISGNLQAQVSIEQKPYNVQQLFQKTFGGNDYEYIDDVIATKDGGLFLTGLTLSNNNGDVIANHGDRDAWLIKLNSNHDTVWTRVMGGTGYDAGVDAIATADGGFIMAGYTTSNSNGDVGASNGMCDWWIIKLKSNGETAWTKLLGGLYNDFAERIVATADGGFMVVGETYLDNSTGNSDVMVVKFNSVGNIEWQKTYGGLEMDVCRSLSVASNGAIFIAAFTESNNSGDVGATNGFWDYWIIKLKANGDKEWTKVFGGSDYDSPGAITSTSDGGALIAGNTYSNQSGNVGATHGSSDVWIIKVNASGGMEWNKLLGGSANEDANAVAVTPDGGYLITGSSASKDGDVGVTQGQQDLWLLKLNTSGKILWSKTHGGPAIEYGSSLLLNADGSFYVSGYTEPNSPGKGDAWLLKYKDH